MKIIDKQRAISFFQRGHRSLPSLFLPFLLFGVYAALFYLFFFGYRDSFAADTFSRAIGEAPLYGQSVAGRIFYYLTRGFLLLPALAVVIPACCAFVAGAHTPNRDGVRTLQVVSACGLGQLALLFFMGVPHVADNGIGHLGAWLTFSLAVLALAFCIVSTHRKNACFAAARWAAFVALALTLCALLLLRLLSVPYHNLLVCIIFCMLCVGLYWLRTALPCALHPALTAACFPLILLPALLSLLWEVRLVCNQYSLFFSLPLRSYAVLFCAVALMGGLLWLLVWRRKGNAQGWERAYPPALLAGLGMLAQQPAAQIAVHASSGYDLFEAANAGCSVHAFLTRGALPIIENFDAHMLGGELNGTILGELGGEISHILYGVFNNDALGAVFRGYSLLALMLVLLFAFYRIFFTAETAFLLAALLPWGMDSSLAFLVPSMAVLLVLHACLQQQTAARFVAFWLCCLGLVLYQLDLGVAYGVGAILTLLLFLVASRRWRHLSQFLIAGGICAALSIAAFWGLCLLRGVAPFLRLREFIAVCLSSESWAYSTTGGTALQIVLFYLVLPLVCTALLLWVLQRHGWLKSLLQPRVCLVLALFLAYLLNFQRGLVRHSLAEGMPAQLMLGVALFCALCWVLLTHRSAKEPGFVLVYLGSVLLLCFAGGVPRLKGHAPLASAAVTVYNVQEYTQPTTQRIHRAVITPEFSEPYEPVRAVLDALLTPEQTFLDFTGNTLLYPLTNRIKPVYVNQSPELLSSEFTQQCFLQQIAAADAPLALLMDDPNNASRDEVRYDTKFYLISELIATQYTPLTRVGIYQIWCKTQDLAALSQKLPHSVGPALSIPDALGLPIGPDGNFVDHASVFLPTAAAPFVRYQNLRELAFLWGSYDISPPQPSCAPVVQAAVTEANPLTALFSSAQADWQHGNYVHITASATADTTAVLRLWQGGTVVCSWQFAVHEGTAQYKIRTSAEAAWYLTDWDKLTLSPFADLSDVTLALTPADTLAPPPA